MLEFKDLTGRVVGSRRAPTQQAAPYVQAPSVAEQLGIPKDWEVKDGWIFAPDERRGTLERFWPSRTLDDPQTKAVLSWEYRGSFGRWLKFASKLGAAGAFDVLPLDDKKALSEGIDSAGGFLVPPELSNEIVSVVRERSTVRSNARVLTTTSDHLDVPSFDYQAEWVGETPPSSETTITPIGVVGVNVYKLRVKARVSRDLFNDQPSLAGWLTTTGGQQIALAEDRAFISAPVGLQPLGFISRLPSTSIVDVEGSTADTISSTTAAAGSTTKLVGLEANLPDAFRVNARWFMAGATLAKVRQLVSASGNQFFPDYGVHPITAETMLMGHPVSTSSAMPLDGTNGNLVVALVDLSQYLVATHNMLSIRILQETYADTDQVGVLLIDRVGGVLGTADAIRVGQV
jgi:HK97 family phage major capsid protein